MIYKGIRITWLLSPAADGLTGRMKILLIRCVVAPKPTLIVLLLIQVNQTCIIFFTLVEVSFFFKNKTQQGQL